MNYIRIKNNIICLDDICNVEPNFSNIIIHFKNGTYVSIYFSDCDTRDAELNYIWLALTNMKQ